MPLISRRSNKRLLQIRQRATFGRAVRPSPNYEAPAPVRVETIASEEAQSGAAATGDGILGSRRRSPRVSVADEVPIRRIGSFCFQAKLQDVSSGGCRVELLDAYEVGDRVVARFPQLEPLGARVCWAMGSTAGVEFLTTIHPAVFDSLLMRLSAPSGSRPASGGTGSSGENS